MEKVSEPFAIVYDWMFSLPVSWNQKMVYAIIYGYCRNGEECFASQQGLANRLRMHPTAISRAISALAKKGLIRIIRYEGGGQTYVAVRHPWQDG